MYTNLKNRPAWSNNSNTTLGSKADTGTDSVFNPQIKENKKHINKHYLFDI